jgi:hypothetical protein
MKINTNILALGLATLTTFGTIAPAFSAEPVKPAAKSMKMEMMGKTIATTNQFKGIEVKKGTVNLIQMGKNFSLKASKDFAIPGSPAPHWQVVDKEGNTFLLNQLKIAGDKTNLQIQLPSYIKSVAKVQIWCSFAEVVLGEASFSKAVTLK